MATPVTSEVYYRGVYWNDYDAVVRYLRRRANGDEQTTWLDHVRHVHGRPFERALSLNCGTGWVERDLVAADLARSVVGVDYFDDLLAQARAASTGLPIEYVQLDTNAAVFPEGPFDLVLNHAGGHHITRVDAVFRQLRSMLPDHGRLLVWDYTGPHRNQYGSRIWAAAQAVNDSLPEAYRSSMSYPHLPTMLSTDPTEAVHSELLLEAMGRYFEWLAMRPLGGPIAYLVLTHNEALRSAPELIRDELIQRIIEADEHHVATYPEDNLFTYAIGRPRPAADLSDAALERWHREEEERESTAAANGGRYYTPTVVARAEYAADFEPKVVFVERDPPTAYETALRGVGFTAGAFARAVAMKIPGLVRLMRGLRRLLRRRPAAP